MQAGKEMGKEALAEAINPNVDVWWIPDIFEDPLEKYGGVLTATGVLEGESEPKQEKSQADQEKSESPEEEESLWERGLEWIGWGKEEEQVAKETYVEAAGEKANLLYEIIEGIGLRYCPDAVKWWDMLRPLLNPILGEREEMFSWENEFRWMTALGSEATPEWAQSLAMKPMIGQIKKVAPEIAQAMEDDPEMPLEKIREMLQWYVVFKAATGKPYVAN